MYAEVSISGLWNVVWKWKWFGVALVVMCMCVCVLCHVVLFLEIDG